MVRQDNQGHPQYQKLHAVVSHRKLDKLRKLHRHTNPSAPTTPQFARANQIDLPPPVQPLPPFNPIHPRTSLRQAIRRIISRNPTSSALTEHIPTSSNPTSHPQSDSNFLKPRKLAAKSEPPCRLLVLFIRSNSLILLGAVGLYRVCSTVLKDGYKFYLRCVQGVRSHSNFPKPRDRDSETG